MTAKSAKTSPASGIEISILVPVMNESGNIAPLVDEICAALAGRSFEIIYVDDASNDDSPAELAATAARVSQLRVLRHEARAGQSAAIQSALLASRGRLIGVLDGDGQNVPADFPALEAALVAQCPADGQTVLFLQLPFFNHMHRFMPSLVRRHGGLVIGVDVAHRPRVRGTSKYRILDRLLVGISDIFGVIWLLRRAPRQGRVTELAPAADTDGTAA